MSESNYTNNNMITATNLILETRLESSFRKSFSSALFRYWSVCLTHHHLKEKVYSNNFDQMHHITSAFGSFSKF